MTTLDQWHAALDAQPNDSTLRLVFADWLEERGDASAPGYRALGKLSMAACHHRPCPLDPSWDHWMWQLLPLRQGHFDGYTFDAQSPDWTMWFRSFCPRLFGKHFGRSDGGRRAADFAAAVSFVKLPADAQARLLAQEVTA